MVPGLPELGTDRENTRFASISAVLKREKMDGAMYRTNDRMVTYATPHMFSILIALRQLDDFEEIKDRISDQHS